MIYHFYMRKLKIKKWNKLLWNVYDKKLCRLHNVFTTSIKKTVHGVIQFPQKFWLKSYIDMSNKLRKEAKIILQKTF